MTKFVVLKLLNLRSALSTYAILHGLGCAKRVAMLGKPLRGLVRRPDVPIAPLQDLHKLHRRHLVEHRPAADAVPELAVCSRVADVHRGHPRKVHLV